MPGGYTVIYDYKHSKIEPGKVKKLDTATHIEHFDTYGEARQALVNYFVRHRDDYAGLVRETRYKSRRDFWTQLFPKGQKKAS